MYENGKFIPPARNPNAPSEIKKRIAALKKQLRKERQIKDLLRKEQALKDQIKGGW